MTIIASLTCTHCSQSFDILQEDRDFYDKISPRYKDYTGTIPNPTLCPDCRQRRRLSFRNERKLYRRSCDASNKQIISIYSPDKPHTVYDQKIRRGDSRDPMDFGRDFDFSKTFTDQFGELMKEVPMAPLTNEFMKQENCDYTNSSGPGKNCYMSFEFAFCENIHHCKSVFSSNNCIDCTYGSNLKDCYGCIDSDECFSCKNVQYCNNCSYCIGCYNCKNCQYCINCDGLENQKYCIENISYSSKEKFEIAVNEYVYRTREKKLLTNGKLLGNENVNNSHNVQNSNNVSYSFGGQSLENVKYCGDVFDTKDTYDFFSWGEDVKRCYEMQESGRHLYKSAFLWLCRDNSTNLYYSFYCSSSSHLFGCIGLRNKSYCILNKQYTKEEYNILVPKIIQHMQETGERGEFFHPSLSPFGYNETVAQEYFPVSDISELAPHGYHRSEYNKPTPNIQNLLDASELPSTQNATDEICTQAIQCEVSGQPFRIIKQELEFYRKHNLPLPTKHPDVRHSERMSLRR